jgi:hypothetical protein
MATTKPATQVAKAGRAEAGMDAAEDVGQQAVARHGEPDAGLAELKDQDRRDHAHERAEQHGEADEVQAMPPGSRESGLSALTTGAPSPIDRAARARFR